MSSSFNWDQFEDTEFNWDQFETSEKPIPNVSRFESLIGSFPRGVVKGLREELMKTPIIGKKLKELQQEMPELVKPEEQVQEEIAKTFPSQDKFLERALERSGKLVSIMGPEGLVGGFAGEGVKEAGAPEFVENIAEAVGSSPRLIGKGIKALGRKLLPPNQKAIEQAVVGTEELPKRMFGTAEEALGEATPVAKELPKPAPIGEGGKSLSGRVTQLTKDLGLKPSPSGPPKDLSANVGNKLSPYKFENTTKGGQSQKNYIINQDERVYRDVNKLYKESRELNKGVEDIHPALVNNLTTRLEELKTIPAPSGPQKQLITAIESLVKRLADVGEGGVAGYRPISNQALIDQAQSFRQMIDYDFTHGDAKNIFKPVINELEKAVQNTAQQAGNSRAVESLNKAKSAYKDWVTTFDNDYVRPIRNSQNKDYSKLFKSSLDMDEFNQLRPIFDMSEEGKLIERATVRDLVESKLDKYYKNPGSAKGKEFNKDLRELESVLSPEEIKEIKNSFSEYHKPLKFKAEKVKKEQPKFEKPEDILKQFDSVSGIRNVKKEVSPATFDKLGKQKLRSLLRENNIEKDFKGDDLYKVLNKQNNYEIFSEIIGEEATETARLAAKEAGQKQLSYDTLKKFGKGLSVYKLLKALGLVGAIL